MANDILQSAPTTAHTCQEPVCLPCGRYHDPWNVYCTVRPPEACDMCADEVARIDRQEDIWQAEAMKAGKARVNNPDDDPAWLTPDELAARWRGMEATHETAFVASVEAIERLFWGGPISVPGDPNWRQIQEADEEVRAEYEKQKARKMARDMITAEEAAKNLDLPDSAETTTSLVDELAAPVAESRWLVQDVFPSGGNVTLAAQFKAGKSTLMINLVRALADRTPFLGEYDTDPDTGPIAYWNYELDPGTCREWFRSQRIGHPERVHVLHLRGRRLPLIVPQVETWAVEWLRARQIGTLIVDPFARAFSGAGDENSNTDVGRWLEALDVIKHRAGVANLIMPLHTGRSTEAQDRARGATRLDDWADVRWVLTRKDDDRYLAADGRDVHLSTKRLGFAAETGKLWVAGESERAEKAKSIGLAVCNTVALNPGIDQGELVAVIVERAAVSKTRAIAAVKAACAAGRITRAGSGRRGDPFTYTGGGGGTAWTPDGFDDME